MKKIGNKGNLPRHLRVLATQLGGRLKSVGGTEFYEANSVKEFESKASDIGYEIIPTIDTSTGRGFLVGFDVTSPEKIATLLDYSKLKIYYIECSAKTITEWTQKIKQHRLDQQENMRRRQAEAKAKHDKNPLNIKKEDA